jgi:hypothetical protein
MNIEQANNIPLSVILEKANCYPTKETETDAWYRFRDEKTASFHVCKKKNRWQDFGCDRGGDVVDLVCWHLEESGNSYTKSDALRWLANMVGNTPIIRFAPKAVSEKPETDRSLVLKGVEYISHPALIKYIENRGIELRFARRHLTQAYVLNKKTGKHFFALALKNEENGYELRNQNFKGCVRKKHITFIRGKQPKPHGVNIFEGMFDYLTYLTIQKKHDDDVIILNSVSLLNLATAYIKGYGYTKAITWLHNDKAGERTTELLAKFFKTEENLTHKRANSMYHPHKDLNAYHMDSLNLKL